MPTILSENYRSFSVVSLEKAIIPFTGPLSWICKNIKNKNKKTSYLVMQPSP